MLVFGDGTRLAHDDDVAYAESVARIMYEELLGFLDELLILWVLLIARDFYGRSILHGGLDDRPLKGLSCCGWY